MSQVWYQFSADALRGFLEQVARARDDIEAAAPVDSEGRFLDDGTYSDDQELLGMSVRIVSLDSHSLGSLSWNLHWAMCDVIAAAVLKVNDNWHVAHRTVTRLADVLNCLRDVYARVLVTSPEIGDKVSVPRDLSGIVSGATDIPANLDDIADWPRNDLPRALRELAELNFLAHRIDGHGKSWEPGFKIVRHEQQWQVTFITYQFDDGYSGGREHVFTGVWDEVTRSIRAAAAKIAQYHELTPAGGDLEPDHPLAALSMAELLNLPDGVELHLAPGHLTATGNIRGVGELLQRFNAGLQPRALIEFGRYAVREQPCHSSVGEAIGWTDERYIDYEDA